MKKIILFNFALICCLVNCGTTTPIHELVGYKNINEISRALKSNPQLANLKDTTQMTPLHWAVMRCLDERSDDTAIVELLIQYKADVNALGEFEETPLHLAAGGCYKISELLIKNGANVNAKKAFGITPLHEAVELGSYDIAKLLLEKGAAVNAKDDDGKTPLANTFGDDSDPIVKLLKQYGAK